jgi:hypothetical protein
VKNINWFEIFHFSKKRNFTTKKEKEFAIWKVKAFCQQIDNVSCFFFFLKMNVVLLLPQANR